MAHLEPAPRRRPRRSQRVEEDDGGEIQVHGSSDLLQTLLAHDLVDTLRIRQFPFTLGAGKELLAVRRALQC